MKGQPPTIGPYRVERLLAVGSDSRVFRGIGRRGAVALKVARMPSARPRLKLEAQLLARCANPHLVRLLHAHPAGDWIALEHLQGDDMATWAQTRTVDDIAAAALELLEPIRHLHELGVLHGDIKPKNVVMVSWGHPKLLDLAGALDGSRGAGTLRGTPGFAAPEVLGGAAAGAPSDLYGFGATLYACLTGRAPFQNADPSAVPHLAATSTPLPPSAFRVDIPGRLDRLVMSLLARHPLRRPELPEVVRSLSRLHRSVPAQPIVGMLRTRASIHHLVATASDGTPACLVLYGPTGSGRRTLAEAAVRQARAEGMRVMMKTTAKDFLHAARNGLRPVSVVRASSRSASELARRVMTTDQAALIVLISARPIPELTSIGAVHHAPEPLDLRAAKLIGRWLGVPAPTTTEVWDATRGHPQALWLGLRPHAKRNVETSRTFMLPRRAARLLTALRERHGSVDRHQLGQSTRLDPEEVIDLCATLEAAGLIVTEGDGRRYRAVEAQGAA